MAIGCFFFDFLEFFVWWKECRRRYGATNIIVTESVHIWNCVDVVLWIFFGNCGCSDTQKKKKHRAQTINVVCFVCFLVLPFPFKPRSPSQEDGGATSRREEQPMTVASSSWQV